MVTYTDFAAAKAAADESEQVVSWCQRDGGDCYFLTDPDVSDEDMWDLSYQARFGERMNSDDLRYLRSLARQVQNV